MPPSTNTRSQADTDALKLKHALCVLLGADTNHYDDEDMVKALLYAGVKGFNDDFICLTEDGLHLPYRRRPQLTFHPWKFPNRSASSSSHCQDSQADHLIGILPGRMPHTKGHDQYYVIHEDPIRRVSYWTVRSHQAHSPLEHSSSEPKRRTLQLEEDRQT